jgi:hypothetical protein
MFASRRLTLGSLLTVGTLAATLMVTPVHAQGGRGGGGGGGGFGGPGGGMAQLFDPSVSTKELDSYAVTLGLDKSQKEAVKALFDAYQQQFNAAAKTARAKFDAAREEARDDPSVWRDIQPQMDAFRKTRDDMEKSFFSDVKSVLNDQQTARWPAVEREHRREHTVSRGLLSGERVDLIKLVDDLKLPADAKKTLDPTLEQYAIELDKALIARNEAFDKMQGRMRDLFQGDISKELEDMFNKSRETAIGVRDVNRKYQRTIEASLSEDKKAAFVSAFKAESYPRIYRPSYASRVIDAAAGMADLEDSQKQSISSIKETYARDTGAINKDLEAATEEQEKSITPQNLRNMFGPGAGQGKLGDLMTRRRELDRDTEEKVKALLNDKQKEKLPQRGNNNDPNAGGGRRGQGGAQGDAPARRNRPAATPQPDNK